MVGTDARRRNAGSETLMEKTYLETVRLLLEIAPEVFRPGCFAMKGGTALNLFLHEMPRLSVDIDLVYLDHTKERAEALTEISNALAAASRELSQRGFETKLVGSKAGDEAKLLIRRADILVKVEVNHVFRGTLLPVVRAGLSEAARKHFTLPSPLPVLAAPELYGGKIVATLDRQHPRDLFDITVVQRHGGLTAETANCFVGYLAGHNRPIHEVLFSNDKDISAAFAGEFQGMTTAPVSLEVLVEGRARLRRELMEILTDNHKRFLLSLATAEPEWNLMPFPHLRELPAVKWKLLNLTKLKRTNSEKFVQQANDLKAGFARG